MNAHGLASFCAIMKGLRLAVSDACLLGLLDLPQGPLGNIHID